MRSEALQRWVDKKIAFSRWTGGGILAASFGMVLTLMNTRSEGFLAHSAVQCLVYGAIPVAMHLVICFDRLRYRPTLTSRLIMGFGHLLCLMGFALGIASYDMIGGVIAVFLFFACMMMLDDAETRAKNRPIGVVLKTTALARLKRRLFAAEFKVKPARSGGRSQRTRRPRNVTSVIADSDYHLRILGTDHHETNRP